MNVDLDDVAEQNLLLQLEEVEEAGGKYVSTMMCKARNVRCVL